MSIHEDGIKEKDKLYIFSPTTGFLHALALEDREPFGWATFRVAINSEALPGIQEMVINTNTFDVWKDDNPEVLKKIAQQYIKPHITR